MIDDEIVREVRAVREAFAAQFGYNIRAMAAHLRKLDALGDRVIVRFPPRPVTQPEVVAGTPQALPETDAPAPCENADDRL